MENEFFEKLADIDARITLTETSIRVHENEYVKLRTAREELLSIFCEHKNEDNESTIVETPTISFCTICGKSIEKG